MLKALTPLRYIIVQLRKVLTWNRGENEAAVQYSLLSTVQYSSLSTVQISELSTIQQDANRNVKETIRQMQYNITDRREIKKLGRKKEVHAQG